MKNAVLLLASAMLVGCRHDPPVEPEPLPPPGGTPSGVLRITFRPIWDGTAFDKTNVYLSAANERVLIQQVKFYLSPLVFSGDTTARATDAVLLDLVNGPEARSYSLPVGTYDSLHYGLGLPYNLNHADVTGIDPGSDLGAGSGMYWTWATMYRFLIFEGRYDTDPAGTGTPPCQFRLHTGRDACYRERTIATPLAMTDGDTTDLIIDVDVARFFTDGNQLLDLSQGPQAHGEVENLGPALRLSDLAVKAINAE